MVRFKEFINDEEAAMLGAQVLELLELLNSREYRTASELAAQMGISEKTVRLRIKDLKETLCGQGAAISSRARYGYHLEILDAKRFACFREEMEAEQRKQLPENGQERSEYLLAYLLYRKEYVKIEELCDFLYVSKTTLSNSLKGVEAILKRYHLCLNRRPNYGIRMSGNEVDIRRLLSDYFIKRHCLVGVDVSHQDQELHRLAELVKGLQARYEIAMSEMSFENFVEYLYVAGKRMKAGYYLTVETDNLLQIGMKEQAFIQELTRTMSQLDDVEYTREEIYYLELYLAGKRMIGNMVENDSNFIIHEQTDRLAVAMMDLASREFGLALQGNFEVRMTLNQHLVPFDVRIRYDIPLKNPLLPEIKENYSLAYQIAMVASQVLREYYQKDIPEDEIGYFALIFALALERQKSGHRMNILVVCSTGKATSRLLKYKYEQEFAGYVNQIHVCDLSGLDKFDFRSIDYVFTTVPIAREIPVPIVEVGLFLENDDIHKITDILKRGRVDHILRRFYRPERLLTGITGRSKEDILYAICQVISRQEQVDEDFYEMVLEREAFVQMDYGNEITLPHPNRIASEETFAYVAVLPEPVIWNQSPVRVILLSSVGRKEEQDRQQFYEATARFALSRKAVQAFIKQPEYEMLMKLLQQ